MRFLRPFPVIFAIGVLALTDTAGAESKAVRTVVLVRHGHYAPDPNADPRLGPGLTDLGVAQARLVGARLAAEPVPFDAVFVSPLQRAQDTARVIAENLHPKLMATLNDLAECTPPTRRTAITADMKSEELTSCAEQIDRVAKQFFTPAEGAQRRELLVCHGNVIRYLITRAMAVDSKAWLELSVGHTSETVIRIEADGSMQVIAAGDRGHLPVNLQTGSAGDPERDLAVPAAP